jgi:low affinity Fe/Cu permease
MARRRAKASSAGTPKLTVAAASSGLPQDSCAAPAPNGKAKQSPGSWSRLFSQAACATARFTGQPLAFLTAVALVVLWAVTGPLFNYSDTWQLVINTSTTIVTFLMVFLIQHTQNRDTLALQVKLSELIMSVQKAENRVATVEDLSEEELEAMHADYRQRAEQTMDHLKARRGRLKRAS